MENLVPFWLLQLLATVEHPTRSLDVLEVFSGQGRLHQACQALGFAARGFDNAYNWQEDINTFDGFMLLLLLVLSIRQGGLLWLAPPCSWWIFLSHSNHQRAASNQWSGDIRNRRVLKANHLASAAGALIRLAMSRLVQVVVEQPLDSCMFNFPEMAKATRALPYRGIVTYLAAFDLNFPCPKPLQLWGSCSWLRHLRRTKPNEHQTSDEVYSRTVDGQITGGRALTDTASYPEEFGAAA